MKALLALMSILISVSAASVASAEGAIKLRAGEHSDYSRIVIPDMEKQWSISTSGRVVEITFPSETPDFDLSDLTEKRKAHRVLSAHLNTRGEERVLTMTLACDCAVQAAQSFSKAIVIDIFNNSSRAGASPQPRIEIAQTREATPGANASPETHVATTKTVGNTARASSSGETHSVLKEAAANAAPINAPPETHIVVREAATATAPTKVAPETHIVVREPAASTTENNGSDDTSEPKSDSLIAARDRMIALLAEARARGVVQIRGNANNEDLEKALSQAATTDEEAPDSESKKVAQCIDPAWLADQPQDTRDYEVIIALRGEFDDAMGEERLIAARALAAAYLRIGFFDEASAVALSTGDGTDSELTLAAALAELAGASQANATRIITSYAECGPSYEVLTAAVRAKDGDDYVAPLSDKQFDALNAMMRSLRGPLAEILALNAIDFEETTQLRRFHEIASRARAPELTQALALIEAVLPNAETEPSVIDEPLVDIAQLPGPMQSRALGELAAQYERDATIAYEGFLEDLTVQSSTRPKSAGDARASIAGARALASAGRIVESIDLLENAASESDRARNVARSLAQSILVDALAGDDDTSRFLAVEAFLKHTSLVASKTGQDDELVLSVAREVANLGFTEITDGIINASSHSRIRPETTVIRALALLNAGADEAALALVEKNSRDPEAAAIATRAAEHLGDKTAVINTVRRALRQGNMTEEVAMAAWRAGEWKLTVDAYTQLASENADDGLRLALAAFMSDAKSMPDIANRALANDPSMLEMSQQMFASAPQFSPRVLEDAVAYSTGLTNETTHIRERLNDE